MAELAASIRWYSPSTEVSVPVDQESCGQSLRRQLQSTSYAWVMESPADAIEFGSGTEPAAVGLANARSARTATQAAAIGMIRARRNMATSAVVSGHWLDNRFVTARKVDRLGSDVNASS